MVRRETAFMKLQGVDLGRVILNIEGRTDEWGSMSAEGETPVLRFLIMQVY